MIMDKTESSTAEIRALVFKALAHPSRISIVEALVEWEHCVNELTDLLGIDASTTSRHLADPPQRRPRFTTKSAAPPCTTGSSARAS